MARAMILLAVLIPSSMLLMLTSSPLAEAFITNAKRFPPPYTKAACGPEVLTKAKTELLVGLPNKMWLGGKFCGKQVAVSCIEAGDPLLKTNPCIKTSPLGGPVLTATVVEHASGNDLLLSEVAFAELAPVDAGLLKVNITMCGKKSHWALNCMHVDLDSYYDRSESSNEFGMEATHARTVSICIL